ncbi:MAG: hypothetical protein Fur0046_27540 [Cyanobacteria bacterium J069]|nr:MAG: hypothetical protein D6742_08545 [Cyanobacteria bacterium J069]
MKRTQIAATNLLMAASLLGLVPGAIASEVAVNSENLPASLNQAARGCSLLNGTYHEMANGNWICLYGAVRLNPNLGIHCNLDYECDRLVYRPNANGNAQLQWERIISEERHED